MKKAITLAILPFLLFACKKPEKKPDMVKKYAKYAIAVYEDQTLKKWMATLSKAEGVEFDPAAVIVQPRGEDIAQVTLSDGKTGYTQLKHFADAPVVFVEDTKCHDRNNPASRVFATIPKGAIGFIVDEKGEWIQVFVGNVGGKWITRQWVRGGYSTDETLLIDAKIYEEAMSVLANPAAKESQKEEAKEKLEDLASSPRLFSDLASKKLAEMEGTPETPVEEAPKEETGGAASE